MEIAIIGSGVVGQCTGKSFARFGHNVTFYDLNKTTIEKLLEEGYTAKYHEQGKKYDVIFGCTPESMVEIDLWKEWYEGLITIRSTVPVGTCSQHKHICHNPCFVRESIADFEAMNPSHVVIGECCRKHGDILAELYKPFNVPIIRTDPTTSEMVKLANNAYLATQVSFWNQIQLIADKFNVNSHIIGKICALDPRISQYGASMHGKPYAKACLPKDISQLKLVGMKAGATTCLLDAVQEINNFMRVKEKEE